MEVTCQKCQTKLNIPDEKIPKDQMVRVSCPKCKNKITLDSRKAEQEEAAAQELADHDETGKLHLKFIESKGASETEEKSYGYDDFSGEEEIDTFAEDAKLALALTNSEDVSSNIRSAVEELGYKYVSSPNTRDATGKMRYHHFDLIVLDDGFDGQELENSPVLNFLNHLSMSQRRRIFVALISDKYKTMDEMIAFALSANAVINPKDLERLATVLKKGISEYKSFYKVYFDTLVEVGKA